MMRSYAQTNIQLYNQLKSKQYAATFDLERIQIAYGLAVELFAGRFRANGKSFLAHLIGTASILSANDAAPKVIAAGLLHAAYPQGRFSDPRPGITPAKRIKVRSVVGPEVENLIAEYATFPWNRNSIPLLLTRDELLDATKRNLASLRLANELEDHLDLEMAYCEKTKSYLTDEKEVALLRDLAVLLGLNGLANDLVSNVRANNLTRIHPALISKQRISYSVSRRPFDLLVGFIYKVLRKVRAKIAGLRLAGS